MPSSLDKALDRLREKNRAEAPTQVLARHVDTSHEPKGLGVIGKLRLISQLVSLYRNFTMKSWKTTLGGLCLMLVPIVPQVLPANFIWVQGALTSLGGFFLAHARDNNVTSEQVGAGK